MELLRFTTAGSVDDGKSTLIGRLLYDSKSIFEDQLEAVEAASRSRGGEEVNLALLTDGLRSEREQGITIDVAYRYFATPRRKFIIADTPGHIQYTRNMVTGASTADLAIILIDARNGVKEQTVRHSFIASMLGIGQVAVCVNKMDLVDFSQRVFDDIVAEYKGLASKLGLPGVHFIPISAKLGDNVVERSANMPWYRGQTLMELLESAPVGKNLADTSMRMPVQSVIRPMSDRFHDYRGYAGRVASGVLKVGDRVTVWPGGRRSTVKAVNLGEADLQEAQAGGSVAVQLTDDIDIGRGDLLAGGIAPTVASELKLQICWFNERALTVGGKYTVRHTTREVQGIVKSIDHRIDIETLREEPARRLEMNDIAVLTLKTSTPLAFDPYQENRTTGSVVFIDPSTMETVGAGIIL